MNGMKVANPIAIVCVVVLLAVCHPGKCPAGDSKVERRTGSRVDKAVDEFRDGLGLRLTGPGEPVVHPSPSSGRAPGSAGAPPPPRQFIDQAIDDHKKGLGIGLREPDEVSASDLARLFAEDQSDRIGPDGRARTDIDWKAVSARDRKREAQILGVYRGGGLKSGSDYYHAAMILQHSNDARMNLLAHEFAIISWVKRDQRARWLVAASEDRFLMKIGQPQRFGTQYQSKSVGSPLELYRMDNVVTNELRKEFEVPSPGQAMGALNDCPVCKKPNEPPLINCSTCEVVSHAACWAQAKGCPRCPAPRKGPGLEKQ